MLTKCNRDHSVPPQVVSLSGRMNLERCETSTKHASTLPRGHDELRAGAEFIAPVSPSLSLADTAA